MAPFFLAYGPLVLTDAGLALFTCWTLWTFGSLWKLPERKNSLLVCLSFFRCPAFKVFRHTAVSGFGVSGYCVYC